MENENHIICNILINNTDYAMFSLICFSMFAICSGLYLSPMRCREW